MRGIAGVTNIMFNTDMLYPDQNIMPSWEDRKTRRGV